MSTSPPRRIGEDGLPVRAIAFSSGGVDTAMQLGVAHALLTIQGKAPDAVVGCSAGAISAVALTEVFQAGADPRLESGWNELAPEAQQRLLEDRQRDRVARFRQILDGYLTAPGDLARAFAPDTLQVEARKPLAPLELPIHDATERKGRKTELLARQGLINLINDLLSVRISMSSLTKFIRRGLGCRAAREIRSRTGRGIASGFEIARTWSLVGVNLLRVGWIIRPMLRPFLAKRGPTPMGSTAGSIISAPRWRREAYILLRHFLGVLGLVITWVGTTMAAVTLPWLALKLLRLALILYAWAGLPGWASVEDGIVWFDRDAVVPTVIGYLVVIVALAIALSWSRIWQQIVTFNKSSTAAIVWEAIWETIVLVAMLAAWFLIPAFLIHAASHPSDPLLDGPHLLHILRKAVEVSWVVVCVLAVLVLALRIRGGMGEYIQRLLSRYDIADGLLSVHPLRQFFIRLFHPDYYGERMMDDVIDRALRDDYEPSALQPRDKLIGTYESKGQSPPIAVGLMVANLSALRQPPRGTERIRDIVEVVPPEAKVIDGLLAATAVSPFFPPVVLPNKVLIDAANVAVESTRGVLNLLRDRANERSSVVELYSVSHLPFSSPALRDEPANGGSASGDDTPEYLTLLDVAHRSLLLQRFRDATLDRRLTELFTKAMPVGRAVTRVNGTRFLRVWVTPVEPEQPLEVAERLTRCCTPGDTRRLIMETVADGCRASLEVMIRENLPEMPDRPIKCREAVIGHLSTRAARWSLPLLADAQQGPPDAELSPGLPEICRHCKVSSRWAPGPNDGAGKQPPARSLVIRPWEQIGRAWPHEYEVEQPIPPDAPDADRHFVKKPSPYEEKSAAVLERFKNSLDEMERTKREEQGRKPDRKQDRNLANWKDDRKLEEVLWPRNRATGPGRDRPLVSFLFSGGVFRGVYQLGTLNALSEAGLEPDVIAGASVGSITAAMVAQAFCAKPGRDRDRSIGRIAATYLAIDRLILTDRFADFIRGVTLRAAETRFSLRQADGFFRRYDHTDAETFDREARTVVAGLERLFWLSPFELKDLVKAFRLRRGDQVYELLRIHTQEWLDRMGVGNQVLGAEPLELLIAEHVLQRIEGERWQDPNAIPFDRYLQAKGMYFLATTTNLTMGRLEILGEQQLDRDGVSAYLKEGLLASSAFPGVFRPRWSWEVMPGTNARHQYIDGGVMDNLPLDAVAQFLRTAADQGLVARRPRYRAGEAVPHLLFSASLEINPDPPTVDELQRYGTDWPLLWRRARQLKYNKKLDLFAETQRGLREIHAQFPQPFVPLDLEVVMVRPRWLCGTFGFHPMLGFRQARQAESIAHGCATGLLELARTAKAAEARGLERAEGWGLKSALLPDHPPVTDRDPIVPGPAGPGRCWFRPNIACTFSAERMKDTGLPQATIDELERIHTACKRPETHQARDK